MQLEMEMKLSRKLRERANNRNADEPEFGDRLRNQHSKLATKQLNDSDKEDSDEQSSDESEKSETGSNISMENHQREPQTKFTGVRLPRKQIVCHPGNFHKRVRETSGNSGPEMKNRL